MNKKTAADHVLFALFLLSLAFLGFLYGYAVGRFKIFPGKYLDMATAGFQEQQAVRKRLPWYYRRVKRPDRDLVRTGKAYPGLNLVTKIESDDELVVEIVDLDGGVRQRWEIDWFELWPDAKHVPERRMPKSRPGTHVHGAVLMENGDLVFNFEHLGLVRLDPGGEVVWRLPYQTHHSIHRHDDGNLWVCGQKEHEEPDPRYPNRIAPFAEYTVLEVTPGGGIVGEWSVPDLLRENGLRGLLFLGSLKDWQMTVRGDTLHLNDAEPFPETMPEGFFGRGDVLVSLRNINTVFVFNRFTRKVKYVTTGRFIRQHDPDFLDGNRFSVFDNNFVGPQTPGHYSRVLVVTAGRDEVEVAFEGRPEAPFFTEIMGKHQWLPNGNLLLTESTMGRAFEVAPAGEIVWEYRNLVGENLVGLVEEVQRLPEWAGRLQWPRPRSAGGAEHAGR